MKIDIEQDDFGTLCITAIRYCHGRQSYMPDMVRNIIYPLLGKISDKDLAIMVEDCSFQKRANLYGDPNIDKPGWIKWQKDLEEEWKKRCKE